MATTCVLPGEPSGRCIVLESPQWTLSVFVDSDANLCRCQEILSCVLRAVLQSSINHHRHLSHQQTMHCIKIQGADPCEIQEPSAPPSGLPCITRHAGEGMGKRHRRETDRSVFVNRDGDECPFPVLSTAEECILSPGAWAAWKVPQIEPFHPTPAPRAGSTRAPSSKSRNTKRIFHPSDWQKHIILKRHAPIHGCCHLSRVPQPSCPLHTIIKKRSIPHSAKRAVEKPISGAAEPSHTCKSRRRNPDPV